MSGRTRRPFSAYGPTVELEFEVTDESCFLVGVSTRVHCELVVDETLAPSGEHTLQFVSVYDGAATEAIPVALEWPSVLDARTVASRQDATLVEFVIAGPSLVCSIVASRAIPRHVSANRGTARAVLEVPPSTDTQQVIDVFRVRHPDSKLRTRREYEPSPTVSPDLLRDRLLSQLTDRQRESLLTAYERGYFDTPRTVSATECASTLGISQSTFSQHLNVALSKVFQGLLEPHSGGGDTSR